jgi:hypothetical protein
LAVVTAWNTRPEDNLIKEEVEALKRIAASDINDPNTLHPSACANVARATLTKLTGEKQ